MNNATTDLNPQSTLPCMEESRRNQIIQNFPADYEQVNTGDSSTVSVRFERDGMTFVATIESMEFCTNFVVSIRCGSLEKKRANVQIDDIQDSIDEYVNQMTQSKENRLIQDLVPSRTTSIEYFRLALCNALRKLFPGTSTPTNIHVVSNDDPKNPSSKLIHVLLQCDFGEEGVETRSRIIRILTGAEGSKHSEQSS